MESRGVLWIPMEPWIPVDPHGIVWMPMHAYGPHLVSNGFPSPHYELLCSPVDFYGFIWMLWIQVLLRIPMDSLESLYMPESSYGFLWIPTNSCELIRIPMDSDGVQ